MTVAYYPRGIEVPRLYHRCSNSRGEIQALAISKTLEIYNVTGLACCGLQTCEDSSEAVKPTTQQSIASLSIAH